MAVRIVTSQEDQRAYRKNMDLLRKGLTKDQIEFQGSENFFDPGPIEFKTRGSVYDFTQKAKSKIRKKMVKYVNGVLPGLPGHNLDEIRGAFEQLFNY